MVEYLTGLHSIEERLKSGKAVQVLLYSKENPRISAILKLAAQRKVLCKKIDALELKQLGAENIALAIPAVERGGLKWFKRKLEQLNTKEEAFVLILDGVTDPHNLGAILRSAVLFGVDLVLYSERRSAQGDTDTVMRTSVGGADLIAHGSIPNLNSALNELKNNDFWSYATVMNGTPIKEIVPAAKRVLVLGSEGKGVSSLMKKNSDYSITIPTTNKLDSLNVSAAAAISCFLFSAYGR